MNLPVYAHDAATFEFFFFGRMDESEMFFHFFLRHEHHGTFFATKILLFSVNEC